MAMIAGRFCLKVSLFMLWIIPHLCKQIWMDFSNLFENKKTSGLPAIFKQITWVNAVKVACEMNLAGRTEAWYLERGRLGYAHPRL